MRDFTLWHVDGVDGRSVNIHVLEGESLDECLHEYGFGRPCDIRRMYILPRKNRSTRTSKFTNYVHACCRDHASADMHNIRYWRENIRSYACASPNKNSLIKLINDNINQCYSRSVRAMACPSYILSYLSDIKIFRMNK